MEELVELLSDPDTVLRGYIALVGAKIVGHKCMGKDRTLALSFNHNEKAHKSEDVLWCLLEKERNKAPCLYPVVSEAEDNGV
ncbi:MAG: hypothetical protein JRI95_10965 [Deltaproteobacteria bacterium]|nr:hypothetical protein [Deltaproteobacteria bacterium]MBW2084590.1 hypothetical protein [Deltaproteobacteria bacterium]